jgi:hypothetical protein
MVVERERTGAATLRADAAEARAAAAVKAGAYTRPLFSST